MKRGLTLAGVCRSEWGVRILFQVCSSSSTCPLHTDAPKESTHSPLLSLSTQSPCEISFHLFSLISCDYKTTPTKFSLKSSPVQPIVSCNHTGFLLVFHAKKFYTKVILFPSYILLLFIDTIIYPVTEARSPRFILASSHLQQLIINIDFSSLRERNGRRWVEEERNLSSPLIMTPPSMAHI